MKRVRTADAAEMSNAESFEPLGNIKKIVPPSGEDCVDFVVFETADFAEVVADALGQEFLELGVVFAESPDGQAQFAFDQDFDDSLRGSA